MASPDDDATEWRPVKQHSHICSICFQEFEKPKILPCGHTFCQSCLEKLQRSDLNKPMFACPKCRYEVPKTRPIGDYPTNFAILDVIESTQVEHLCPKHKQSEELFCVPCDVIICAHCFEESHKGGVLPSTHYVTLATKPAKEKLKQLRSIAAGLQHSQHTELLGRVSLVEEQQIKDIHHIKEDINKQKEQLIREIEEQAENLIKSAEIVAKDKREKLDDIKNKIEQEHTEQIERAKLCTSLAMEINDYGLSQSLYEKSKSLVSSESQASMIDSEKLSSFSDQVEEVSDFIKFSENPENKYIVIGKVHMTPTSGDDHNVNSRVPFSKEK